MVWKYHDRNALLDRLTRHNPSREHVFLFGAALTAPVSAGSPGVPGVFGVVDLIRQYYIRTFDRAALLDFEQALTGEPRRAYQAAFEHLLGRASIEEANRVIRSAVTKARVAAASLDETILADTTGLHSLEQDIGSWHLTPAVRAVGELLALKPSGFSSLVLTTNFDPLLEISIERAGRHAFCSALDTDGRLDQVHGHGCHVVHLHGYWLHSNTLHTGVQLEQKRPLLQSSLERVLANRAIVVMGYGGWDDVFTSALSTMLEDPQRNIEILWAFYPSDIDKLNHDADPLLQKLWSGYQRGLVTLFHGIDVHWLLPELHARLSASNATSRRKRPTSSHEISSSGEGHTKSWALRADSRSSPSLTTAAELRTAHPEGVATAGNKPHRWLHLGLAALAIVVALAATGFLMLNPPQPVASEPTDPPVTISNSAAAEQTIRRYWNALNQADYATAWPLLSPSFQSSVHQGDYADYEKAHSSTRVCSVSIPTMTLLNDSSNRLAMLVPMTIASGSSCKTRQQTYIFSLVPAPSEKRWLIDRVTAR